MADLVVITSLVNGEAQDGCMVRDLDEYLADNEDAEEILAYLCRDGIWYGKTLHVMHLDIEAERKALVHAAKEWAEAAATDANSFERGISRREAPEAKQAFESALDRYEACFKACTLEVSS